MQREMVNPAKIAKPPRVGIIRPCAFRSSGTSYKCFKYEILMMVGMATTAMIRELRKDSKNKFINSVLRYKPRVKGRN